MSRPPNLLPPIPRKPAPPLRKTDSELRGAQELYKRLTLGKRVFNIAMSRCDAFEIAVTASASWSDLIRARHAPVRGDVASANCTGSLSESRGRNDVALTRGDLRRESEQAEGYESHKEECGSCHRSCRTRERAHRRPRDPLPGTALEDSTLTQPCCASNLFGAERTGLPWLPSQLRRMRLPLPR
jgi:hypothetical protein